jgi:hypothetical protein
MMTPILTLALGSLMIAAAHYVREGAEFSYAAWCLLGIGLVALERAIIPDLTCREWRSTRGVSAVAHFR